MILSTFYFLQMSSDYNVRLLVNDYLDPSSDLFLTSNTAKILKKVKKSVNIDNITRTDIEKFRNYLSHISREREQRLLRGKKRENSFRQVCI